MARDSGISRDDQFYEHVSSYTVQQQVGFLFLCTLLFLSLSRSLRFRFVGIDFHREKKRKKKKKRASRKNLSAGCYRLHHSNVSNLSISTKNMRTFQPSKSNCSVNQRNKNFSTTSEKISLNFKSQGEGKKKKFICYCRWSKNIFCIA